MLVANDDKSCCLQLDDEPKAATATWWQCTLITIEVRKKKAAFLHAALKLEYIGEHSIG